MEHYGSVASFSPPVLSAGFSGSYGVEIGLGVNVTAQAVARRRIVTGIAATLGYADQASHSRIALAVADLQEAGGSATYSRSLQHVAHLIADTPASWLSDEAARALEWLFADGNIRLSDNEPELPMTSHGPAESNFDELNISRPSLNSRRATVQVGVTPSNSEEQSLAHVVQGLWRGDSRIRYTIAAVVALLFNHNIAKRKSHLIYLLRNMGHDTVVARQIEAATARIATSHPYLTALLVGTSVATVLAFSVTSSHNDYTGLQNVLATASLVEVVVHAAESLLVQTMNSASEACRVFSRNSHHVSQQLRTGITGAQSLRRMGLWSYMHGHLLEVNPHAWMSWELVRQCGSPLLACVSRSDMPALSEEHATQRQLLESAVLAAHLPAARSYNSYDRLYTMAMEAVQHDTLASCVFSGCGNTSAAARLWQAASTSRPSANQMLVYIAKMQMQAAWRPALSVLHGIQRKMDVQTFVDKLAGYSLPGQFAAFYSAARRLGGLPRYINYSDAETLMLLHMVADLHNMQDPQKLSDAVSAIGVRASEYLVGVIAETARGHTDIVRKCTPFGVLSLLLTPPAQASGFSFNDMETWYAPTFVDAAHNARLATATRALVASSLRIFATGPDNIVYPNTILRAIWHAAVASTSTTSVAVLQRMRTIAAHYRASAVAMASDLAKEVFNVGAETCLWSSIQARMAAIGLSYSVISRVREALNIQGGHELVVVSDAEKVAVIQIKETLLTE